MRRWQCEGHANNEEKGARTWHQRRCVSVRVCVPARHGAACTLNLALSTNECKVTTKDDGY